ncbi:hypothetical protein N0V88_007752 [Collariella sp. IMI 366227]|nr:hypothetical protein N0V88_007752 [Collariella sp. IMI 366227]
MSVPGGGNNPTHGPDPGPPPPIAHLTGAPPPADLGPPPPGTTRTMAIPMPMHMGMPMPMPIPMPMPMMGMPAPPMMDNHRPWHLIPGEYAGIPFHCCNVPANITMAELLVGFGADNPDKGKNQFWEVYEQARLRIESVGNRQSVDNFDSAHLSGSGFDDGRLIRSQKFSAGCADDYIRVLHDRIRRLEKVCTDNGNPIPPLDPGDPGDSGDAPVPRNESTLLSPIPLGPRRSVSNLPTPHSSRSLREEETSPVLRPPLVVSPAHERLDATESAVSITAMGTVSTEHDACQAFDATNEFYGSSSAASFMKEACTSVKPHRCSDAHVPPPTIPAFSVNFARSDTLKQTSFAEAEKFALPPRNLADHLLSRFWERVYWLYPFFHKPTFLQAYERIWRPANQQSTEPSVPGLGLGSPGADSGSIVFHCALNTVFALGCQFSDLSPRDKASAIETFFNRSKAFVGLDFIDMHNVGRAGRKYKAKLTGAAYGTPLPGTVHIFRRRLRKDLPLSGHGPD